MTQEERQARGIWKAGDGRRLHVSKMETKHLEYVQSKLLKHISWNERFIGEVSYKNASRQGNVKHTKYLRRWVEIINDELNTRTL